MVLAKVSTLNLHLAGPGRLVIGILMPRTGASDRASINAVLAQIVGNVCIACDAAFRPLNWRISERNRLLVY